MMLEWENGSITHEPLNIFCHGAPEICAEYGQKHDLLNEPGRKCFHLSPAYDKCH